MQQSVLLKDWHPLDQTAAPDYMPPYWDGPHAGKRLVEALQTLRRLPAQRGPKPFGTGWPEYAVEFHDAVAQAEADQEQKEADARAQNWVRILPSAAEIGQMEQAIVWPARYLRDAPHLRRCVLAVAFSRSRGGNIDYAARRLKLPSYMARRWNRDGLDTIAAGLRRDAVRIF